MKAKELFEKANQTEDDFDRFSTLWQSFNNLFSNENGSNERAKIKSFIDNKIDTSLAKSIIHSFESNIEFLISRPVINMDNQDRDTQRDINAFISSASDLEKLKALFMIVYQVRCNLIHGEKSPSRDRDIDLCKNSFNIIAEVVKKELIP